MAGTGIAGRGGSRAVAGGDGAWGQVNRDTMSFATKLSHIVYEDGKERDVMKTPKTDTGKVRLRHGPPPCSALLSIQIDEAAQNRYGNACPPAGGPRPPRAAP